MDQGKQVQAQLYNKNTRVLPRLKQSQKVMVQLDPDKNIWTPAELSSAQPTKADHIVSRLYTVGSARNRRFIKPDLTEAGLLEPKPDSEPRMPRPTMTIRNPDRLIESK